MDTKNKQNKKKSVTIKNTFTLHFVLHNTQRKKYTQKKKQHAEMRSNRTKIRHKTQNNK